MDELFFKKKPIKVLLLLNEPGEWYLSKLSKKTDSSYVFVTKILKKYEIANLVFFQKHGRNKQIRLTEKGQEIAKKVNLVYEVINKKEENK